MYMDLLVLFYCLMVKLCQQGMFFFECDIENLKESEIFVSYLCILVDVVMFDFIVDYLCLIISGNMNMFEIEVLMDEEIEIYESEVEVLVNSLVMVGDLLFVFGIVVVVMGVVYVLVLVDCLVVELGVLIVYVMVGMFFGILLVYGFILLLVIVLCQKSVEIIKMMQCVKIILLFNLNGYVLLIVVEFGCKMFYFSECLLFIELEEYVCVVRNLNQQQMIEEV